MNEQKIFSVIIPHHNTPDLLARCLDSIPQRDDTDVFVIDDNSNDQYAEHIANICAKHKNVVYIPTKEGLGAGYARNVGLKQIRSKWVLFADADDYFLPNAWEHLEIHKDDEAELIHFHAISRFSDTGAPGDRHIQLAELIDRFIDQPNETNEGWLRYNYNEPWGKMIRTSVIFENHITFEQTRWANDLHFSTMVGACAKTIAADKADIYCVTIAHGSLVHQHSLESRKCRYEVILRNNAYLRTIGKAQFQYSLMYSLRWAAKLGGIKAVWEFIRLGQKYHADFTIGAGNWIRNFFRSKKEYKNKSKYIVTKLLISVFFSATATTLMARDADTIRIMTYNISAGEIADMQQLGAYIREIDPDLIALQEVDFRTNRTDRPKNRGHNQPTELGYYTDMLPAFVPINDYPTGGFYGLGFLTKYPVQNITNIPLPQIIDKQEPRTMLVTTMEINKKTIHIVNTHLSLDVGNRKVQLQYIRKYVKKLKGIKIICGDLNSNYNEGLVLKTFSKWNDALPYRHFTFPNRNPNNKFDWILYEKSAPIHVINAIVDASCQLSDHLPCYVDIIIE